MKAILKYIRAYFVAASFPVHLISALFTAVLIFCNYFFGLNKKLFQLPQPLPFAGWYLLLVVVLLLPYLLFHHYKPGSIKWESRFWILLLMTPFVFSWKMVAPVRIFPHVPAYFLWNSVLYFSLKALVVTTMLLMLRNLCGKDQSVMGLRSPVTQMTPYFLMLLLMVPLIAAAATQPDFLQVYPKIGHMLPPQDVRQPVKVLLFETAYGIDFFTIELFFRGFLVIYFARWAGSQSILPMAVMYCVIHFGKPLGECISSFFGGMLLGIVSYHTRSIWGGLAVHLGIAWLMELAGWLSLG